MKKSTAKKFNKFLDQVCDLANEMDEFIGTMNDELDALRERYDNMSEKRQESEAGEALNEKICTFETAISNFEDLMNSMQYGEDYRVETEE